MARSKHGKGGPSPSEAQQAFLKQATARLHKVENHFDELIQQLHNEIDTTLMNIPPEIQNLTLGELIRLDLHNNENITPSQHQPPLNVIPPSTEGRKTPAMPRTKVSTDDGYDSEINSQGSKVKRVSRADNKAPSTSKRPVGRAKRSLSSSECRQRPRLRSSTRAASTSRANKLQTPAPSQNQAMYNPVTPKVKPNTPMSILRIPRTGEMALSMQGSPLLVSAVSSSRTANVNVPLRNGNIISLLPNDGLRMSTIPQLDESTLQQLQTLKSHIEKVIGNH